MIEARYSANTQHGITSQNQGRLEVGTLLGILANTIPAVFYMLVHVYSEPALLREIRDELETTSVSSIPGETTTRYLRILSMRENCHLLHSTFQELLRVHALGAGARFVREDVMLDKQYFLKKGMVVQMPTAVMHSDPTVWGTDVLEFRPRRFLNKHNSTAYRPFGGGASLCPGRHFVTLETLALTACMVLRYDIASVDGHLSVPPQKQDNLATNVFPPEKDVRVRVTERQEYRNVTWNFIMS
jgi:cytochrome P450